MYQTRAFFDAIAQTLDHRGASSLADEVDAVAFRIFASWYRQTYHEVAADMSYQEAQDLLGLRSGATEEEINRAYKQKALEHHPDRGGDPDTMVKVNVARDILMGKEKPAKGPVGQDPTGPIVMRRKEPWGDKITFEEAAQKAKVPMSGVTWKWATTMGFGGYGDNHSSGYVIYGEDDAGNHVFVGVYDHRNQNMFTAEDTDIHEMWVEKVPKSQPLAQAAPRIIRELWQHFGDVKGYNAKILVFKEPTTKFSKKFELPKGRTMSFKDAMGIMGEERPASWKGKVNIEMELGEEHRNVKVNYKTPYGITLVVNGRSFELSDKSLELIYKSKVMTLIFGDYYYSSSKKNLTKMTKMAKEILGWLSEKLTDEPQELRDALMAAAVAKGFQPKAA